MVHESREGGFIKITFTLDFDRHGVDGFDLGIQRVSPPLEPLTSNESLLLGNDRRVFELTLFIEFPWLKNPLGLEGGLSLWALTWSH
jgi:hypothetical protein